MIDVKHLAFIHYATYDKWKRKELGRDSHVKG